MEAWDASVGRDSVSAYEMACCVPAEDCDREAHAQYVLHVCCVVFTCVRHDRCVIHVLKHSPVRMEGCAKFGSNRRRTLRVRLRLTETRRLQFYLYRCPSVRSHGTTRLHVIWIFAKFGSGDLC
jgi:hypothetical protein